MLTEEPQSYWQSVRPTFINLVVVVTPNTTHAGPGYQVLAISHWSVGLLTQAPIGHHTVKKNSIDATSTWMYALKWLNISKSFDLERNASDNKSSVLENVRYIFLFLPFYKTCQRHRFALVAYNLFQYSRTYVRTGQRGSFRCLISTLEFTCVCLSVPNWRALHHTVKIHVILDVLDDRW